MLACTIHAKEDLRIETAEIPVVGPGEVLVRLGAGGICGSDLHYYFEGRNGSFVIREPLIPGHEASGVVALVGSGVARVKEGDKIAGAFRWGIEFDWAVDYLSTRRVDVRPLISGVFPLRDAVKAFELAKDKTQSTKVQVVA